MASKLEIEKLRGKRIVSNSPFNSPLLRPTEVPINIPVMNAYSSQSQPRHFDIHREIPDSAEEDNNELIMDSEDMEQLDKQTEVPDAYYESDYSEESEEEVDPAVQEDMEKFQATFKGIKDRFRLINRIGEGKFVVNCCLQLHNSNNTQAHSPPSTKPKTSATTNTTTTGTSKRRRKTSATGGALQEITAFPSSAVAVQR